MHGCYVQIELNHFLAKTIGIMSAVIARDVLFFAATSWTMATSLATYGRYSQRMIARRLSSTVKDTQATSPNGAWLVGEHQPAPYANKSFKSFLSSDLRKAGGLYSLAISAVIPRPIALVTSQDKDGNINCAPYSYFNLVSHDPPLIIVGNSLNVRSATKKKDTLRNIEETGNLSIEIRDFSWIYQCLTEITGWYQVNSSSI